MSFKVSRGMIYSSPCRVNLIISFSATIKQQMDWPMTDREFLIGFETNNARLLTDQKIRTRDMYCTFDKAIRHKMSNVSSADGQCQQRKLNE